MSNFLQSKEWEEFQKYLGRETFRVDGKLLIKYPLVLGQNYLYSPRPEFKTCDKLKSFLAETKKIAHHGTHTFFIRFEPTYIENILHQKDCPCKTFKKVKAKQPEDTLILELAGKGEETILAQMKQKTRYNIRLSEKKGVKIRVSFDPVDIDIFYNLGLETAKRDGIKFHPREYYQKMMEVLGPKGMLKLYMAYIQIPNHNQQAPNKFQISNLKSQTDSKKLYLAANLVLFYNKTAYYLHGASSNSYRNLMAPYLLQWQAICDVKKAGCEEYDFWGIAPLLTENSKFEVRNPKQIQNSNSQNSERLHVTRYTLRESHPWTGITRFKFGFAPNGKIVHYPGCFEVVFRQGRYLLYSFLRRK